MRFLRADHVGLAVPDLDEAVAFFVDVGGHHLCLVVDDLDAAVADLGHWPELRIYDRPGRLAMGAYAGGRWIYFRARWGLQVELIAGPPSLTGARRSRAGRPT